MMMKPIFIKEANYVDRFTIFLRFSDGQKGAVDFKELLNLPIYEPLHDQDYFKQFTVNQWTISWPNGADFAPEFLHDLVLKGSPIS